MLFENLSDFLYIGGLFHEAEGYEVVAFLRRELDIFNIFLRRRRQAYIFPRYVDSFPTRYFASVDYCTLCCLPNFFDL